MYRSLINEKLTYTRKSEKTKEQIKIQEEEELKKKGVTGLGQNLVW